MTVRREERGECDHCESLTATDWTRTGGSLTHLTPLYSTVQSVHHHTPPHHNISSHHTTPIQNLLRRAEFDLNHPWIPCYAGRLGGWEGERLGGACVPVWVLQWEVAPGGEPGTVQSAGQVVSESCRKYSSIVQLPHHPTPHSDHHHGEHGQWSARRPTPVNPIFPTLRKLPPTWERRA